MLTILGFGVVVALLGICLWTPLALGIKNKLIASAFHEAFKVSVTVGFATMLCGAMLVLTR